MSKSAKPNLPDREPRDGNIGQDELSTNEAVTLPWFVGEEKFPLHWICPVHDAFTRDAPTERPGKK